MLSILSPSTFFLTAKKFIDPKVSRKSSKVDRNEYSSMLDIVSSRKYSKPRKNERNKILKNPSKPTKRNKKVTKSFLNLINDKIGGVQRKGYKYYLEVMASGSSEFECSCIKATRPNNDPPKEKYVTNIIAAVNNFDEVIADNDGAENRKGDDFDPYEIALHKIWIRIANKQDYRIKLKALYVLHRLWSSVDFDSAAILKKRIASLSKRKCKKTRTLYFSKKSAIETHRCHPNRQYLNFLEMYSKYVFFRCRMFSSSFEEGIIGFKPPSASPSSSKRFNEGKNKLKVKTGRKDKYDNLIDILEQLKEALFLIASYSSSESIADDITASCFSLLRKDVQHLYVLYEERLKDLIEEYLILFSSNEKRVSITSPQITEIVENPINLDKKSRDHISLCEFYIEITGILGTWILNNSKMYRDYDYDTTEMKTEICLSPSKVTDHINFVTYRN